MNSILLLCLLVIIASVVAKTESSPITRCTNGKDPVKIKGSTRCSQYDEQTCCPTTFAASSPENYMSSEKALSSSEKSASTCQPLSDKCSIYKDLLFCAKFCSPSQGDIYDTGSGSLIVCEEQAKKMYDDCKDDFIWVNGDWKCHTIGDKYKNAKAFVETYWGDIYHTEDKICWNGATTYSLLALLVILIVNLF